MASNPRNHGAGRKKGTPNKLTQDLMSKCEELGVDPFEVLLHFAKGDWKTLGYDTETRLVSASEFGEITEYTITPELRAKAAKDACEYLFPKRKAVEHSGSIDTGLQSMIESLEGKTEDELAKIAASCLSPSTSKT
jgi:hypothetical protein